MGYHDMNTVPSFLLETSSQLHLYLNVLWRGMLMI